MKKLKNQFEKAEKYRKANLNVNIKKSTQAIYTTPPLHPSTRYDSDELEIIDFTNI